MLNIYNRDNILAEKITTTVEKIEQIGKSCSEKKLRILQKEKDRIMSRTNGRSNSKWYKVRVDKRTCFQFNGSWSEDKDQDKKKAIKKMGSIEQPQEETKEEQRVYDWQAHKRGEGQKPKITKIARQPFNKRRKEDS